MIPQFQYKCKRCHVTFITNSNTDIPPCPICKHKSTRQFSFTVTQGFQEHYNNATGTYVSSKKRFYDTLKAQSDEASTRTGIEHNFQPIDRADMADPTAHGVTEEGLDSTRRRWHDILNS